MGAHYDRGLISYQTKQYQNAEKEFYQELVESPGNASAHAMLAITLCALKQSGKALKEAKEAISLAPEDAYCHYAHAFILNNRNQLEQAKAAIEEAIRLNINISYQFALASSIAGKQKQWDNALELANKGLEVNAHDTSCINAKVMWLIQLGQVEEADTVLKSALELDPEDFLTFANKGWIATIKQQPQQALEYYREALRLNPNSQWARQGVVVALKSRNPVYNAFLSLSFWLSTITNRFRILVCIILVLFIIAILNLPPSSEQFIMSREIVGAIVLILIFALFANNLLTFALHFDPLGRIVLADRELKIATFKTAWGFFWFFIGLITCMVLYINTSPNTTHRLHKLQTLEAGGSNTKSSFPKTANLIAYQSYIEVINKKIKDKWRSQKLIPTNGQAKVSFSIYKNGIVSNTELIQSSGNSHCDKLALDAISKASPFPSFPSDIKNEKININFTFNYVGGDTGL